MIYVKNPPKHAAEISIQSIFLVKILLKSTEQLKMSYL